MKYIAPAVLSTVNATSLIQGGNKNGIHVDSGNATERSLTPAYGSDE